MTPHYLRIIFVSQFLVAVVAVFTAWSEIGGQAVLDAMPWGWKFGLGIGLPVAIVLYTAALFSGNSIWSTRSARWLALMIVLVLAMGVVTYYYALQVNTNETDEQENSTSGLQTEAARPKLASAKGGFQPVLRDTSKSAKGGFQPVRFAR